MPHTSVSGPLAHKLITVLPSAAKKDPDQALLRALPAIRQFLASVSMRTLVELAETLQPHISFLLPNKVVYNVSYYTDYLFAYCLLKNELKEFEEDSFCVVTLLIKTSVLKSSDFFFINFRKDINRLDSQDLSTEGLLKLNNLNLNWNANIVALS